MKYNRMVVAAALLKTSCNLAENNRMSENTNVDLPFANASLIVRSIVTIARRRSIEHAPNGKNNIKERKKTVFLVAKILCWSIINSVDHLVEGRLVYKSQ